MNSSTDFGCLHSCEGVLVTSFDKTDMDQEFMKKINPLVTQYKRYKGYVKMQRSMQGNILHYYSTIFAINICCSDYQWMDKLRFVRIYFDTATLDRITKDRSAKFVDQLSAIGGTMGLLTGFSIISGVEILYFISKYFGAILCSKKY